MSDNGCESMCIARIANDIVPLGASRDDAASCMDLQGTFAVSKTVFLKDIAHTNRAHFCGYAAVIFWFVRMFKDTTKRIFGVQDVFNLSLQPQRT